MVKGVLSNSASEIEIIEKDGTNYILWQEFTDNNKGKQLSLAAVDHKQDGTIDEVRITGDDIDGRLNIKMEGDSGVVAQKKFLKRFKGFDSKKFIEDVRQHLAVPLYEEMGEKQGMAGEVADGSFKDTLTDQGRVLKWNEIILFESTGLRLEMQAYDKNCDGKVDLVGVSGIKPTKGYGESFVFSEEIFISKSGLVMDGAGIGLGTFFQQLGPKNYLNRAQKIFDRQIDSTVECPIPPMHQMVDRTEELLKYRTTKPSREEQKEFSVYMMQHMNFLAQSSPMVQELVDLVMAKDIQIVPYVGKYDSPVIGMPRKNFEERSILGLAIGNTVFLNIPKIKAYAGTTDEEFLRQLLATTIHEMSHIATDEPQVIDPCQDTSEKDRQAWMQENRGLEVFELFAKQRDWCEERVLSDIRSWDMNDKLKLTQTEESISDHLIDELRSFLWEELFVLEQMGLKPKEINEDILRSLFEERVLHTYLRADAQQAFGVDARLNAEDFDDLIFRQLHAIDDGKVYQKLAEDFSRFPFIVE